MEKDISNDAASIAPEAVIKRLREEYEEGGVIDDSPVLEDSSNGFPTERIDLPSQGWFYSADNPLSKGYVDLHYMTAKHEDIITSPTLIKKGVVIDRLLQSLIATKGVKYSDLLIGDKDAITLAARILGYGKKYPVTMRCPSCGSTVDVEIDLQEIDMKDSPLVNSSPKGTNEFEFELPVSKRVVTFSLMTVRDERVIELELERLKKIDNRGVTSGVTTRLKNIIKSIDGSTDAGEVRRAVDTMISVDARALRNHIRDVTPGVDMKFDFVCYECDYSGVEEVPLGIGFFWPDAEV